MASLGGRVIAFLEARMPSEMASLIQRHGGVPYSAPVLQEVYQKDSPEVAQLITDVCQGKLDAVVLLTGVGARALIEAAETMGKKDQFLTALNRTTIIARSPKPARVLRQHQVHIDVMPPEPYTSQELVAALQGTDLRGKEVAVQHYGGPNSFLVRRLREEGARVREVTVYTWDLPEDQGPVLRLIDGLAEGKIDAVAFTSQPQVDNLLTIAAQAGKEGTLRESLNGSPVAVASIGPVCSRKLRERGIKVDVEPEQVHMGNLVLALGEHFSGRAATAEI